MFIVSVCFNSEYSMLAVQEHHLKCLLLRLPFAQSCLSVQSLSEPAAVSLKLTPYQQWSLTFVPDSCAGTVALIQQLIIIQTSRVEKNQSTSRVLISRSRLLRLVVPDLLNNLPSTSSFKCLQITYFYTAVVDSIIIL